MAGSTKPQVIARKKSTANPRAMDGDGAAAALGVAAAARRAQEGKSRMAQLLASREPNKPDARNESASFGGVAGVAEVVVPRAGASYRGRGGGADVDDLTVSSPEVDRRRNANQKDALRADELDGPPKAKSAKGGRTSSKRAARLQDIPSDLDSDVGESTLTSRDYKKLKTEKVESKVKQVPPVLSKVSEQDGAGPRLVIRRTFLEDKPIDSPKSWTRLFKKNVDAVMVDKVFPFLKFVNDTSHLGDVGYMGYIFEQLGYGGDDIDDSNFRTKNWNCIADYTQRKITSHRNNVVTDCRRMINGKKISCVVSLGDLCN
jgi:hypothetical protein